MSDTTTARLIDKAIDACAKTQSQFAEHHSE